MNSSNKLNSIIRYCQLLWSIKSWKIFLCTDPSSLRLDLVWWA